MNDTNAKGAQVRRIVGTVVSTKGQKTVTVLVDRSVRHPLYGKYVRRSTRLHAHDEDSACHEGDFVAIVETRPISKTKFFRVVEILGRETSGAEAAS